jgi:hypothetical protein
MHVEVIGVLVAALGVIGWIAGPRVLIHLLLFTTLLGAAAAIVLTSLGSANIMPAHLLLGFLIAKCMTRRENWAAVLRSLSLGNAGFWLGLTAIYAVLAAIFLPRFFAGSTFVYAMRNSVGPGLMLTPLRPTASNITQTVYFLGDVSCFLVFYAYASQPAAFKAIVRATLVCAAANLCFAALDLVTYWTHTQSLLDVIRNAGYRMLDESFAVGLKRIVGSFPEASTFAYATVGLFAFCFRLALAGVYPATTQALAAVSACALLIGGSSTGYTGAGAFLGMFYLLSAWQLLARAVPRSTLAMLVGMPLLLFAALVGLQLWGSVWTTIVSMFDVTVLNKLSSQSGIERTAWTQQAWDMFLATHWLGAGTGSVRGSSFPVAVLGNIGAIGALTYGVFLLHVFLGRQRRWTEPFPAACASAARWACFALLASASVTGSFIDLGLPFFIFAGLACSGPMVRRPIAAQRPARAAARFSAALPAASD